MTNINMQYLIFVAHKRAIFVIARWYVAPSRLVYTYYIIYQVIYSRM